MSKRILILDDDVDILDILSVILLECRYVIEAQLSGEKIFEVINAFHPDLVLMDVMLADMDGRIICRNIKENSVTRTIPVILISATHDLEESLHQQGAPNDFIKKPFDIDNLINKIERQLVS